MSADVLPIEKLHKQINEDYYERHMSLKRILFKYRRYDSEAVKRELGIYDLGKEPVNYAHYDVASADFRREWNDVCRRLNPKAEAWRNK